MFRQDLEIAHIVYIVIESHYLKLIIESYHLLYGNGPSYFLTRIRIQLVFKCNQNLIKRHFDNVIILWKIVLHISIGYLSIKTVGKQFTNKRAVKINLKCSTKNWNCFKEKMFRVQCRGGYKILKQLIC